LADAATDDLICLRSLPVPAASQDEALAAWQRRRALDAV
jgi:hypothetical protein